MTSSTDTSLLDILETHGKRFLDSFKPHKAEKNKRKRADEDTAEAHRSTKLVRFETDQSNSVQDSVDGHSDFAEEWSGFGSNTQVDDEYAAEDEASLEASTSTHIPDVVIFSGDKPKTLEPLSKKTQSKAFMSSNISKLRDTTQEQRENRTADPTSDEDNELTNAQNDALLHRLVHTQLLSGSLNPELGLTSAQRKKAMEGRILELSGSSKLGQGEKIVRAQERDKASKRVREGLLEKQKQRRETLVQEAKDMGNYHPAFKKSFQDPPEKSTKRNRETGLRMGVGSYGEGTLRLSKREIESVQNRPASGRSRGRPHKKT